MRSLFAALFISAGLTGVGAAVPTNANASGESLELSAAASHASVAAVVQLVDAGFKLVSATASVPLDVLSAVGAASGQTADALREAAGQSQSGGLRLSEEVITAYPSPAEMLNRPGRLEP